MEKLTNWDRELLEKIHKDDDLDNPKGVILKNGETVYCSEMSNSDGSLKYFLFTEGGWIRYSQRAFSRYLKRLEVKESIDATILNIQRRARLDRVVSENGLEEGAYTIGRRLSFEKRGQRPPSVMNWTSGVRL